jgi:hypothetical protein
MMGYDFSEKSSKQIGVPQTYPSGGLLLNQEL